MGNKSTRNDSIILDAMRGISAILVMISHIRNFVIKDFAESGGNGILKLIFYGITGLGHFSVVIFFVISGLLISNSVKRSDVESQWSVNDYILSRFTRLWTVLIPCLIITCIVDSLAVQLTASEFYQGSMTFYNSGTQGPIQLGLKTFLCNLLFLQNIIAPVYGSNTPLWSLSCEFWYYILFPMIFIPLRRIKKYRNTAIFFIAVTMYVVGCFAKWELLRLFLVWLIGYAASVASENGIISLWKRRLFTIIGLMILFLTISLGRFTGQFAIDFDIIEAIGVALIIVGGLEFDITGISRNLVHFFSKISYTLYIVHFPIVAFLSAVFIKNVRFDLSLSGIMIMSAFAATSIFSAYLLYLPFEKNTREIKSYLARRLKISKSLSG